MISPEQLKQMIRTGLPDAEVQVQDLTGGGDHYQVTVISSAFAGQSLVQQHRLVNDTVNDVMATGELHAFAIKTFTPEKWAQVGTTAIANS